MKATKNGFEEWMIRFLSKKNTLDGIAHDELITCNLFERGLIDSMGVMTLVMELESEFEIMFTPDDFQDRRFSSVQGLFELMAEKQGKS